MTNQNSEKSGVQVRISLLNTPEQMSPLKFRSWLNTEISDVQAAAHRNSVIIVRLYMTNRLRHQINQRRLDQVLQKIVDKYPSIYRIELYADDHGLTTEEMIEEGGRAEEMLGQIGEVLSQKGSTPNL